MPELDGVSILSLASFGLLMVAWMIAPGEKAKVGKTSHAAMPKAAVAA